MEMDTTSPSSATGSEGKPLEDRKTASPEMVEKTLKSLTDLAAAVDLLALNTEMEAARMGTGGEKFTAVAEDIRALLHRASKTGFEIKGKLTQ